MRDGIDPYSRGRRNTAILYGCHNHFLKLLGIKSEPEGDGHVLVENKCPGDRKISHIGHLNDIFPCGKAAYDIAAVIPCDSPSECLPSLLHGHRRR